MFHITLQMHNHHHIWWWHFYIGSCFLSYNKNVLWFVAIITHLNIFGWIWSVTPLRHHHLGVSSPFFGHLIHQTCHYVLYSQFLHYHDVLWGNKMFVQGWQILKQSHDNIFISQIFFQARKFNPQVPWFYWCSLISHPFFYIICEKFGW